MPLTHCERKRGEREERGEERGEEREREREITQPKMPLMHCKGAGMFVRGKGGSEEAREGAREQESEREREERGERREERAREGRRSEGERERGREGARGRGKERESKIRGIDAYRWVTTGATIENSQKSALTGADFGSLI